MEKRIDLRGPDDRLDDVVVRDVSMFRAEMLDARTLWLACYLKDADGESGRVVFEVTSHGGALTLRVTEGPDD
ncbi:hypothetical protein OEB99_06235 [Actinotalea sp. M2MS4P-6]|uniref:hypothetical protein n=1 Tax=Actinotalea sp. M2MS4P-6 TaxID=2983762 RepID=UPI0021E36C88|nr:hypothetical protein [Actinotalea sp. M2MS4P-6]MCV2393900.1 hypothetical protein [Actinotalea sp. M2MS4P-6]